MSDRAQALANEFSELSKALISTVESMQPAQFQERCVGEQCTVAALGAHVAGVHRLAAEWIQTSASGQPLPSITMDMVDQANATQFAADADRPKAEVLEALRGNGAQAARLVRGLSDDELDRRQYFSLFDREVTTEDLVRNILIFDVRTHLASIEQVAAGSAAIA